MSTFFKPYEGKRPYVFISYSHRDSEQVLNVISALNERRLRLWYDEGIPAGSDWPKNIELHMRGCAAVLFFVSETALASPNCFSEIKTAAALKKPILLVPLESTAPNDAWKKLLLPNPQAKAEAAEILSWKALKRSFYRRWTDSVRGEWIGLAAAALLLLGSVIGLGAAANGFFDPPNEPTPTPPVTFSPTPDPTPTASAIPTPTINPELFPVRFPDSQQENAVRGILGKEKGDVLRPEFAAVRELYFCGHMILQKTEDVSFAEDGTVRVNGAKVVAGKISDLSVIGDMIYLERLALIDQPIRDLSELNSLVLLQELYLSGNAISDLSSLNGLMSLAALHIEHTNIHDLTVLESLPSLCTVTVSADMLPLTWSEDKPFKVILVP